MLKALIHVTKMVENTAEAEEWFNEIKGELRHHPDVHIHGQTTVKFPPSHPAGTPEEGPPA